MPASLAILILLSPNPAHAASCSGLSTNSEKIACLLEAVEELTAENAALGDRIEAIESDYAASSSVVNLRSRVSTIESDCLTSADVAVDDLSDLLRYVSVDTGADEVVFSGANVYIQSGEGSTDDNCDFYDETTGTYAGSCSATLTGLGNLIIGYNEDYAGDRDRSGSHNLVIGADHSYTSYGGIVAGLSNRISAQYASVSGGRENTASADFGVVSGGSGNTAEASYGVVTGGSDNVADGSLSVVSGGTYNTASADYAVVSGGYESLASGYASVVSGGYQGIADGTVSVVSGGYQNAAEGDFSVVYAGAGNTASSEKDYAP